MEKVRGKVDSGVEKAREGVFHLLLPLPFLKQNKKKPTKRTSWNGKRGDGVRGGVRGNVESNRGVVFRTADVPTKLVLKWGRGRGSKKEKWINVNKSLSFSSFFSCPSGVFCPLSSLSVVLTSLAFPDSSFFFLSQKKEVTKEGGGESHEEKKAVNLFTPSELVPH